jgi:hypothetical protein
MARRGEQLQRLADAQAVRHAEALKLDADASSQLVAVGVGIQPEHAHLAVAAAPEPLEALDRGGLAGPIGAEQPEDLTGSDLKVDAVDRDVVAVGLASLSVAQERAATR